MLETVKKQKINILYLLLCIYIYCYFDITKLSIIQDIVLYLIIGIMVVLNIKKITYLLKKSPLPLVSYIIILIASIVIPIIYRTSDFTYFNGLVSVLSLILKNILLFLVFIKVHKDDLSVELYMKYYIYSCAFLVITTIIFMIFPILKEKWISIINTQTVLANGEDYYSRFSIMGFSGFRQTYMCLISYICSMYIILKDKGQHNKMIMLSAILSFIGTVFYGRIGLLLVIIVSLILLPNFLKKTKHIKILLYIIMLLIIFMVIINILKESNEYINNFYNWAFALFINYSESGSFKDASVEHLFSNMYFMPEAETLFFGDGRYIENGTMYMKTDVGFLRKISFYGIFFTIIDYIFIFSVLTGIIKLLNKEKDLFRNENIFYNSYMYSCI